METRFLRHQNIEDGQITVGDGQLGRAAGAGEEVGLIMAMWATLLNIIWPAHIV